MKAWLNMKRSKGFAVWEFEFSFARGFFVHTTRYGTAYAIFVRIPSRTRYFVLSEASPFRIGIEVDGDWLGCESKLRPYMIEFENGGQYYFPRRGRK